MTDDARAAAKPRLDPLLPAVGLVSLLVFAPHGFNGYLSRDLGLYSYAGQSVFEGDPPYVGLLNRAGPLAHVMPAIGVGMARLVNVDDVVGMRFFFMLLSIVMVCLTYVLIRDVFGNRLLGLLGASTTLCLQGIIEYSTGGPREKTTMAICLLIAMIAMLCRRWYVVGVGVSLATLTWQPVFTLAIGSVLAAVVLLELGWPAKLKSLIRVAIGGAIPLTVFIIYFAAVGHLRDFIDAFFLINLRYTDQVSFSEDPEKVWEDVMLGFGPTRYVVMLGLALMLLAGTVALVRLIMARVAGHPATPGVVPDDEITGDYRPLHPRDLSLTILGFGVVAGIVWSYRVFNGWADALFLVPFSSLGWAWLAWLIQSRIPSGAGRIAIAATTAAAVVWAAYISIDTRESGMDEQKANTRLVMENLPDDAIVWSIQAPQPLVFLDQKNPSKHQMFRNGLQDYVEDEYPGGLQGFADDIVERRPEVLSIYDFVPGWLQETTDEYYTLVGKAPGWLWYVSNDVGTERIEKLKRDLESR